MLETTGALPLNQDPGTREVISPAASWAVANTGADKLVSVNLLVSSPPTTGCTDSTCPQRPSETATLPPHSQAKKRRGAVKLRSSIRSPEARAP